MKSSWPPKPEYIEVPIESAQTCPVRSTDNAELMATMLSFCATMKGSLTYSLGGTP